MRLTVRSLLVPKTLASTVLSTGISFIGRGSGAHVRRKGCAEEAAGRWGSVV